MRTSHVYEFARMRHSGFTVVIPHTNTHNFIEINVSLYFCTYLYIRPVDLPSLVGEINLVPATGKPVSPHSILHFFPTLFNYETLLSFTYLDFHIFEYFVMWK